MRDKEPRKLPSNIKNKGAIYREYHIPLEDYHWLKIVDQGDNVLFQIRDESTETKDIISFDIYKDSTAYNAIIKIFTELKKEMVL